MLFSTRTKIKKLFFDSLTQLTKKGNHQTFFVNVIYNEANATEEDSSHLHVAAFKYKMKSSKD